MSNPVYEYTSRTIDTGSLTIDYTLGSQVATASTWGEFDSYWSGSSYTASIVCPELLSTMLSGSESGSQWVVNFS